MEGKRREKHTKKHTQGMNCHAVFTDQARPEGIDSMRVAVKQAQTGIVAGQARLAWPLERCVANRMKAGWYRSGWLWEMKASQARKNSQALIRERSVLADAGINEV